MRPVFIIVGSLKSAKVNLGEKLVINFALKNSLIIGTVHQVLAAKQ